MRRPIDFLVIGAQKSGTSALVRLLRSHPDVFLPDVKELHFFVRDEFFAQGDRYLDPFYGEAGDEALLGGGDVDLLYAPAAAGRVHAHNPRMRLLAVLRNPVDRAYSAFWFARRLGFEDAATFEEALAREEARRRGGYFERHQLTYLDHGHYAEQLERFLAFFERDRLRVLLSEELRDRPAEQARATLRWLGLRAAPTLEDPGRRVNVAGVPRSLFLQKLLRSDDSWAKRQLRRVLPRSLRYELMRRVRRPLMDLNVRPRPYPPMNQATRARLREHFAPYNRRLGELLGTDLRRWR
jgi:hypothetical protein